MPFFRLFILPNQDGRLSCITATDSFLFLMNSQSGISDETFLKARVLQWMLKILHEPKHLIPCEFVTSGVMVYQGDLSLMRGSRIISFTFSTKPARDGPFRVWGLEFRGYMTIPIKAT